MKGPKRVGVWQILDHRGDNTRLMEWFELTERSCSRTPIPTTYNTTGYGAVVGSISILSNPIATGCSRP